jgi:HTH-type transcriptional regulator, transcriptional repressor of NAD biosynthesis genes
MITGLVVGKFYPPHRGHSFLIEEARSQVDHLDVFVCHREDQTISGSLRAAWLRELHPDVNVIEVVDDRPEEPDAWATYTLNILPRPPDVVFTSEAYGDDFARCLGARHVCIDRARRTYPISGSIVRSNPAASWEFLAAPVRAYFVQRICVVGAESTGTTTLAADLAAFHQTTWVPEYGRRYYDEKLRTESGGTWTTEEFIHIARTQQQLEDAAARESGPLLVCDTDALATSIWHERYLGFRSSEVEDIARQRAYSLYVLTNCDIPFVQDGTREGEHLRRWMTDRFKDALAERSEPWILVSGDREERLMAVIEAIRGLGFDGRPDLVAQERAVQRSNR